MIKVCWKARGKWSWEPENKEIQLILMRQGPGNKGRVRLVRDMEAEGELERKAPVKKILGWGTEVHEEGQWIPGSRTSEVGLVLLELHH